MPLARKTASSSDQQQGSAYESDFYSRTIAQTGLSKSVFPAACPFTREDMMTRPYEFD